MLTPEYLKNTPNFILGQFHEMENDVIKDVARRIKSMDKISATSNYQMNILYEQGTQNKPAKAYDKINQELGGYGDTLGAQLKKSAEFAIDYDKRIYEIATGKPANLNPTAYMNNIVDAVALQSKGAITTLSKTTGFVLDGNFVKQDDYLRQMLNKGAFQISTGAFTYEQVARRYIKELGDKGIRVFNFESGQTREMETHLRNILLDANRQMSNELSMRNAQELGTDLMEISAHAGARPSHAAWQGQLLSLSGAKGYLTLSDIGAGDVAGFGGANCRHSYYPYFEGSKKLYPPRVRKAFEDSSHEYNGVSYSDYEATQKQRAIERGLRQSQRRMIGFDELGDKDAYNAERIRFKAKSAEYKAFSKAMNQKTRPNNMFVYKGGNTALPKQVIKNVQAYDVRGLTRPIRPSFHDYINGVNNPLFIKNREEYRMQKTIYDDMFNKQIEKALNREFKYNSFEQVIYEGEKRGIFVDPEIFERGNDLRAFDELFEVVDEMNEKYYNAMSYKYKFEEMDEINVGVKRIMAQAYENERYHAAFGGDSLYLGNEMIVSYEDSLKRYLESLTDGFNVSGDGTYKSLFRHEIGHNVDNYLQYGIKAGKTPPEYLKELEKYKKELGEVAKKTGASEYSDTNLGELFAEAFASVEGGETTEFAQAFSSFLKRWYK